MKHIERRIIDELVSRFGGVAAEIINGGDEAHPQAFFARVIGEGDAQKVDAVMPLPPGIVNAMQQKDASKDFMASVFRAAVGSDALGGDAACVVIHVTEVWKSHAESLAPGVMPRDDPKREESLMVTIHTGHGSFFSLSTIVDRKVTLEPVNDDASFFGRLSLNEERAPEGVAKH